MVILSHFRPDISNFIHNNVFITVLKAVNLSKLNRRHYNLSSLIFLSGGYCRRDIARELWIGVFGHHSDKHRKEKDKNGLFCFCISENILN